MQFYCPQKNALFALLLDINPFLTMKKKNIVSNDLHFWNGMTETVY